MTVLAWAAAGVALLALVVAAVSVSVPSIVATYDQLIELVPSLLAVTGTISRDHGWRSNPTDDDVDAAFADIVSGMITDSVRRHPSGAAAPVIGSGEGGRGWTAQAPRNGKAQRTVRLTAGPPARRRTTRPS